MKIPQIPRDDLFQEGRIAMLRAHKTFDNQKGAQFKTYASRVVKNRLLDIIKSKKSDTFLKIREGQEVSGRANVFNSVMLYEMNETLKKNLSPTESAVYKKYKEGKSYEEMGQELNLTTKQIDNTMQKIRKILKSSLQE